MTCRGDVPDGCIGRVSMPGRERSSEADADRRGEARYPRLMKIRTTLPLATLAALVGCASAPPPERYGRGWTLLDTCRPSVVRKTCPDARGTDADKCMAAVIEGFNAQRDAGAQRAFLVEHGCPAYVVGSGP